MFASAVDLSDYLRLVSEQFKCASGLDEESSVFSSDLDSVRADPFVPLQIADLIEFPHVLSTGSELAVNDIDRKPTGISDASRRCFLATAPLARWSTGYDSPLVADAPAFLPGH